MILSNIFPQHYYNVFASLPKMFAVNIDWDKGVLFSNLYLSGKEFSLGHFRTCSNKLFLMDQFFHVYIIEIQLTNLEPDVLSRYFIH